MNVELRAEVFNVTNTPPLAAPNTVVGSPGFGSITAAGDPSIFQLGAKFSFLMNEQYPDREEFSRKGAKAQSAAAFLRFSLRLCAFA